MQALGLKNKNFVFSDEVKLLISLIFSAVFGATLIGGNTALYAVTSLIAVCFLVVVVILKPYLFLAVFFAVSYPVSQTVGKLEVNNLGILFLLMLSLLAFLFIFQRKNFAVDKRRIAVFSSFYVIVAVVVVGALSGFLHSGNDSLETVVKFFVFGVIPASFLIVIPLNKENMLSLLELSYYLNFIIFVGFSFAYWFFKLLNPSGFEDFFYGFDNPIGTSLFLMQFTLVSLLFVIFGRVSGKMKIFIYATVLLAFLYVMITFQRSFILAIAGASGYFVVSKYKIGLKMVAVALVAAAVFAVALSNLSMFLNVHQISKLEKTMSFVEKLSKNKNILRTEENKDSGSIGIRIIKIIASWDKTKQNIYFGNGLGTFSNTVGEDTYKYPHNIFYEFLYSTGLAGLFIFLFCAAKIFFKAHSSIKKIGNAKFKNMFLVANSFVVLCFVILQFSGGVMNIFPHVYFMMSCIVLALYWINHSEKAE